MEKTQDKKGDIMTVKIFQMDDITYYAGETSEECIGAMAKDYKTTTEELLDKYDIDPVELTEQECDKLNYIVDAPEPKDRDKRTFNKHLEILQSEELEFPRFFATDEW